MLKCDIYTKYLYDLLLKEAIKFIYLCSLLQFCKQITPEGVKRIEKIIKFTIGLKLIPKNKQLKTALLS